MKDLILSIAKSEDKTILGNGVKVWRYGGRAYIAFKQEEHGGLRTELYRNGFKYDNQQIAKQHRIVMYCYEYDWAEKRDEAREMYQYVQAHREKIEHLLATYQERDEDEPMTTEDNVLLSNDEILSKYYKEDYDCENARRPYNKITP